MWYSYATVRVVPRVERGEFLNVGVVLFAREQEFLGATIELDERRLKSLSPGVDVAAVERHLATFLGICRGDVSGGPIAALPAPERFHWLVAPRSTMIQTSPVHDGRSADPAQALNELLVEFVRPPRTATRRSRSARSAAAGA
ncbi:MAG TPA: DUF3037 domain-containing protein [Chloroflexota bacterium]|nr:DUF3037 domain-containing protein [Chloroflexota bacterium]